LYSSFYSSPIRAGVDGKAILDAGGLRVPVFFVVKIDVLVLPVLVHGEGDVGVLPVGNLLARIDQSAFFLAFLVVEHQSGEGNFSTLAALAFIESGGV